MADTAIQFSGTTHKAGFQWIKLWRADAVLSIVLGDVLIFATGTLINAFDMESSMTTPLRLLGGYLIAFAIWQLWVSRSGSVSKTSYLIADVEMTLLGIGLIAALVLGVQVNTLGVLFFGVFGAGGVLMLAGCWYLASRNA